MTRPAYQYLPLIVVMLWTAALIAAGGLAWALYVVATR